MPYSNYIALSSDLNSCAAGTAYLSINTPTTQALCPSTNATCIAGVKMGCVDKSSTDFAAAAFGSSASYMGVIIYDSR